MDTTDPDITFDSKGICNHCRSWNPPRHGERYIDIILDIKRRGRGREYDAVLGISGGVDSSYTAYLAHREGLRVLLTTFDNGWDTETAKHNIQRIVDYTGWDYEPHRVNPDEFHRIQIAYLRSGVADIEVPTDHGIAATLYGKALEHAVKTILSGSNYVTESIMPRAWTHRKNDLPNLRDILRRNGGVETRTFPTMSLPRMILTNLLHGIKRVMVLDYIDYNKAEAKTILKATIGWRDYGHKHGESAWTRFYQNYILPVRWGYDKRRPHLSNLILNGEATRDEALHILESRAQDYPEVGEDKALVLEKLGLTVEELDGYLAMPLHSHSEYASDDWFYDLLKTLKRFKP